MALLLPTITEAASYLRIAPSTIHRWVKAGKLQHITYEGKERVILEEVIALIGSTKAGKNGHKTIRVRTVKADRR